jgi:hypothetical protein
MKRVLVSDELFAALGTRVEWGEPDVDGFYTPTLYRDHEHYWVDAPDDETGWHCTICGVTEYPGEEVDPEDEVPAALGAAQEQGETG